MTLSICELLPGLARPAPYQPGAELWRDRYIAGQMLLAHLAPDTDAASYRPQTIAAICGALPGRMGLSPGDQIVDLGCGPGLYCRRLAELGYEMTGIDWSEGSIRHARALCAGQRASFRAADYRTPFGQAQFDGALMILEDYGVLSPADRRLLLQNVAAALKPGGAFALDAAGRAALDARREHAAWSANGPGFWRPHPHLLLTQTYLYPEASASCDLYAVLDEGAAVYRNWQTYFTPDSLAAELREGGFEVVEWLSSLAGAPWCEKSPTLAAICRRA
ncbi:MAG: methyltransferase domain-containing protein [Clostridiales bacterium]|nr:methyltransferase domain-containing protein [Clostridiales bacterium]